MARNGTKSGGGKPGNVNASVHNIYLKQLLDKDEVKLYDQMYESISTAYNLASRPADLLLLSTALIDYVRIMRGYVFEKNNPEANVTDALHRANQCMRNNLAEMGITGKNKVVDSATASFSVLLSAIASNGS